MMQRRVGLLLLAIAFVLVVAGGVGWAHETDRADRANRVSEISANYGQALFGAGGEAVHVRADHTGQYALFVAAGLAGLFGMLLLRGIPDDGVRRRRLDTDDSFT